MVVCNMSKDNGLSRRTVLNSATGAIATGLGLSGTTVAKEESDNVDAVLQSTPVQNLLTELNQPQIVSDTFEKSIIELDQQSAGEVSITQVPTRIGDLSYMGGVKSDDIAIIHMDADSVPRGVAPGLPQSGSLTLLAIGDDITKLRSANLEEIEGIGKSTEFDATDGNTSLFKIIGTGNFRLVENNISDKKIPNIYDIREEQGTIDVKKLDPLEGGDKLSPEQNDCLNICTNCLATVGSCAPCWAALPGVVTVAGAIAYLTCITTVCQIALPVMCGQCLDCGT